MKIGTILHTKDGRNIGNGIITDIDDNIYIVTTDYGNKVKMTLDEINKFYYIAYSDFTKETHGFTC